MIVIHTDGSSKNGYSCWAYKSSTDNDCRWGIVRTMNVAGIETRAVVEAIRSYSAGSEILIVSDSLITVRIIQQQNTNYNYHNYSGKYYLDTRKELIRLLGLYTVDAIWVNSENTNETHRLVDHIAKTQLDRYLNKLGGEDD